MCLSQSMCFVVWVLGHMADLLSTMVVSIYIPTSSIGGFPLLCILSSIYCLYTFWWWPFCLVWGDNLIVVFICISVTISDVEHLLMCLWPSVCWTKVFRSPVHILMGFFVFWYWAAWALCQFWRWSVSWFANIFSCSVGFVIFLMVFSAVQRLLSFIWSYLFIFYWSI